MFTPIGVRAGGRGLSVVIGIVATMAGTAWAQEAEQRDPFADLGWQRGPCVGQIGDQAQIQVPEGYRFLPTGDAGRFMEMNDNITSGAEVGVLQPKDGRWFLVFEFEECGYVKDDEKDKLDASQMLKELKEGQEQANAERKKRGMASMQLVGWATPPAYNEKTHNLEWALRLKSEGHEFVNHNTKILGRHGVMVVTWVGDTEDMATALPKCQKLLSAFSYTSGNRYAEFRKGDKIAEYGLTALITGGTAAVLLKTGILQKFFKFIVLGVVAIGGAIAAFFKKLFGRRADA